MKPIDGDALVRLLRKCGMDDAAEIAEMMPPVKVKKQSPVSRIIDDFRASNAPRIEIDASKYSEPRYCYYVYYNALQRAKITDCYVFIDRGRVFLERVPGRTTDGETTNIRN